MLDRIIYRFRQLMFGLTSSITPEDLRFVQDNLDIKEQALFNNLPAYEKKHAVVVARHMLSSAHNDPHMDPRTLARVGLLHDIGKSAVRLSIFEKAFMVALNRVSPRLYDLLASKGESEISPRLYRKVFVYKHHGQVGAEMLRRIGEPDQILTCVEAHDAVKFMGDKYLKFLQEADSSI